MSLYEEDVRGKLIQENAALRQRAETAEAAACVMREALTNLLEWGVEFDDVRLRYITVQVDRRDIEIAQDALASTAPCQHAADTERMNKLEALVSGANLYYDILIQSDEDDGIWVSQRDTGLHGCMPLPDWETKSTTVREAIDAVVLRTAEKGGGE